MQSLSPADPGTADLRVAVVEDGRVTELGRHEELLAVGGSYAALRASWRSDGAPPAVA